MLLRFAVCFTLCSLLAPSFPSAQAVPDNTPVSGAPLRTYPDTPDGLRDLMADIIHATRMQDPAREALLNSLILPSDSTWFTDVFGPEQGATLVTAYRNAVGAFKHTLQWTFSTCAKSGLRDIRIERIDTNDPVAGPGIGGRIADRMQHRVPLYSVSFRKGGKEGSSSQSYVYADGGFRHVPDGVFAALPIVPMTKMRVSEEVALRRLLHRVEPELPKEGVSATTDGRVILTVMIDPDGVVHEISVKQGDPLLAKIAMEAVQQWKFRPFAIGGYPHLRVFQQAYITIRFKGR